MLDTIESKTRYAEYDRTVQAYLLERECAKAQTSRRALGWWGRLLLGWKQDLRQPRKLAHLRNQPVVWFP
jgi:hypothetical protein